MKLARSLGSTFDTVRVRLAALAFATIIVALDLLRARGWAPDYVPPRLLLGAVVALAAAWIAARDPRGAASLGLAPLDRDERRWWWRWALRIAGACALALAVIVVFSAIRGAPLWSYQPPSSAAESVMWQCLVWPVHEEIVYRLALVPVWVAIAGHRVAFVIGAALFALLHVAYGNLDPSNGLGAIVLTWAFLRSGSLALTIGLHAGGNAVVIAANLAMYSLR